MRNVPLALQVAHAESFAGGVSVRPPIAAQGAASGHPQRPENGAHRADGAAARWGHRALPPSRTSGVHGRGRTTPSGKGAGCHATHRGGEPPRTQARRREPGGPAAKHRALPPSCTTKGRTSGAREVRGDAGECYFAGERSPEGYFWAWMRRSLLRSAGIWKCFMTRGVASRICAASTTRQ